jgi:hypothetical protein
MTRNCVQPFLMTALLLSTIMMSAQDAKVTAAPTPQATDSEALVRATSNPVASMVSVPLQTGGGITLHCVAA